MDNLLERAKKMQDELVTWRRHIHQNPEVGLDLPETTAYVLCELKAMGYDPQVICKSSIVAILEGAHPGKTLLLRADMDALPITEINDLPFISKKVAAAHMCGHDNHTAMLLGAAKILMENKDKIQGRVKFMFQPGEEGYSGALFMVNAGLLENPKVDAAMAYHGFCGDKYKSGTMICALDGPSKASADLFTITVQGKGTHGARPETGVDVINILCHIQNALQTIVSREVGAVEPTVLTVCHIEAGSAANVLPQSGFMRGTIRTFNPKVQEYIKKRIKDIADGIAVTLGGTADLKFDHEVPAVINDKKVAADMFSYVKELIGEENTDIAGPSMGAEDFSEVMNRVPGVLMNLSFGSSEEGYTNRIHSPYCTFNENTLPVGAACFSHCAIRWLEENAAPSQDASFHIL